MSEKEEAGLQPVHKQASDGLDSLVRLAESLTPVIKDYVETLTENNKREQETEQLSLQIDYELSNKSLDYEHEERKGARVERREIRRWALWSLLVIAAVMMVAIFRGKESAALEFIKTLITFLSVAAGAYLYGERRADQRKEKQKEKRKAAKTDDDDDQDKESD
jgi:hypothetical protein